MRARRNEVLAWAAVGTWTAFLVVVAVDAVRAPGYDRAEQVAAPAALVEAWERSRTATFVATGTYERSSEVTGAQIASADIVAQKPPRRLHRQLGGVNGRDDDRLLVCPAPPPGDPPAPCQLGPRGGLTYAESVAREVAGLEALVLGPDPLYAVAVDEAGCFSLDLQRADPRAPFGIEASFCFDDDTGAPTARRVRHEGGVEERLVVTDVRAEVTDSDLEP